MKKEIKKNKRNFGIAFAIAGAVVGAAATAFALLKQKKREQVYHEAEMKAMDELDNLNAENENACAECECHEDCGVAGGSCCDTDEQLEMSPEARVSGTEDPAEPVSITEEEKPAE